MRKEIHVEPEQEKASERAAEKTLRKAEKAPKNAGDLMTKSTGDRKTESAGEVKKKAPKKTERQYRNEIVRRMQAVGTYRDEFMPTIERLAMLYCSRDLIEVQYAESGGNPVVMHTNKFGAANLAKNPYLTARDEVYTQLLSHERELGLTPSALKKMNGAAFKPKEESGFAAALAVAFDGAGA